MDSYPPSDTSDYTSDDDTTSDSDDMPMEISMATAKSTVTDVLATQRSFQQKREEEERRKQQERLIKREQLAAKKREEMNARKIQQSMDDNDNDDGDDNDDDDDDGFDITDLQYAAQKRATMGDSHVIAPVKTLEQIKKQEQEEKEKKAKREKLQAEFIRLQKAQAATYSFHSKKHKGTYKHGNFTIVALKNDSNRSRTRKLLNDVYGVDPRIRKRFHNILPKVARTSLNLKSARKASTKPQTPASGSI